ncbi:hypothetical protein [Blastococcus sp. PRF04-17]|uniref:hypothetical protein n=1 Tax=Blastococcus sp. PRF04-17 TaxID=2933797 RepID=UPI001FF6E017|nr:hypothetical protein [Blastococcus sp. PRF04-17]UOY00035.1 hypothetical protein MVA48_13510 [Blastococcus sp. PRF04-17]
MSSPSPPERITVLPDALEALAAELAVLAGELAEDADLCRSTGHSFLAALGDVEGWTAQTATTRWAGLQEVLADSASALAGTLSAAAADYSAQDRSLAARIATRGPDHAPR